jgi:sorting nexin-29
LEKIVRGANKQTNGTIFYKSVQLLAYADDIDIIARSQSSLREALLALECSAKRMGLRVNQEKTKYMISGQCTTQNIKI